MARTVRLARPFGKADSVWLPFIEPHTCLVSYKAEKGKATPFMWIGQRNNHDLVDPLHSWFLVFSSSVQPVLAFDIHSSPYDLLKLDGIAGWIRQDGRRRRQRQWNNKTNCINQSTWICEIKMISESSCLTCDFNCFNLGCWHDVCIILRLRHHFGNMYTNSCPWTSSVPQSSLFAVLIFALGQLFASRDRYNIVGQLSVHIASPKVVYCLFS